MGISPECIRNANVLLVESMSEQRSEHCSLGASSR